MRDLFSDEYENRSRGRIYTDKIWKELDVHSRINIRSQYGSYSRVIPSFSILNFCFEIGFDLTPHLNRIYRKTGSDILFIHSRNISPK